MDKWEPFSFERLKDQLRGGNPGVLTRCEKQLVIELCRKNPRSIPNIIAALFDQTGKRVSESTIKRLLKSAKLTWKQVKILRKVIEIKQN